MKRRLMAAALSAAGLIGLVGVTTTAPALAAPGHGMTADLVTSRTPVDSTSGVIQLTEADNGRSLVVHVRQYVQVTLPSVYHQPSSTGPAVQLLKASGGYPTNEPAVGLFAAVQPGEADLESLTDYLCLHQTPPCALPQKLWQVHVYVQ